MPLPDLQVGIPPLPRRDVECFENIAIPVLITNNCDQPLVVDSLTLRFQTDSGMSDYYLTKELGHEVAPFSPYATEIRATPTPEFLTPTNEIHVLVRYRRVSNNVPGEQLHEKSPGSYIIVKPCSKKLGQLFVSHKQPEDRRLARILERVAERAGFQPYLAENEPTPGQDLWDRLEPRLLESIAVAFVWTQHTEWGDGVEREIGLCLARGITNVLLVQQGVEIPAPFKGTLIEYRLFDAEDPLSDFGKAISGLRTVIISAGRSN